MLSLNASIEAARAGEHGKSFGVVAHEIQKLAGSASSSAKEIDEILKDIQEQTQAVSLQIEKGNNAIKHSQTAVASSTNYFDEINTNMAKVLGQASEIQTILKNVEENAGGIKEDIDGITNSTTQSSTSIQQMAGALDTQTERMESIRTLFTDLEEMIANLNTLTQKGIEY